MGHCCGILEGKSAQRTAGGRCLSHKVPERSKDSISNRIEALYVIFWQKKKSHCILPTSMRLSLTVIDVLFGGGNFLIE